MVSDYLDYISGLVSEYFSLVRIGQRCQDWLGSASNSPARA